MKCPYCGSTEFILQLDFIGMKLADIATCHLNEDETIKCNECDHIYDIIELIDDDVALDPKEED